MRRLVPLFLLGFCLIAFFTERRDCTGSTKDPGAALYEPSADQSADPTHGPALLLATTTFVEPAPIRALASDRAYLRLDGRTLATVPGRGPPAS